MQEHASPGLAQTVPELIARADPTRPMITWYDDATGERVELSAATLGNWVSKTANLLVDGCGLGTGDTALVAVPPHWQTAAVLLGCWSAGLVVSQQEGTAADVVFAAVTERAGDTGVPGAAGAAETYGLALLPLAAPMPAPPPGIADYVREVRPFADQFQPVAPVGSADLAVPGATHAELCRTAAQRAGELGLTADARVLFAVAAHPDPLDWLLAPLAVGATMVLCANLAADQLPARVSAERVTVIRT